MYKTKSAQNMINYTFMKSPYYAQFKYAKIFVNFSKAIQGKLKNVQFLLRLLCKFLRKKVQSAFLFKAFQRVIKSLNLMTESRTKYIISRV